MKLPVYLRLPPLLSAAVPWLAVDATGGPSCRGKTVPINPPEDFAGAQSSERRMIRIVFSDVDGTLVHYPLSKEATTTDESSNEGVLRLPPSMTGMQGIISSRTMQLCRSIRDEYHTKFVLVSGMRTHTMLKRLPYLPKADAYCSEAGGRIFYPKKPEGELSFKPVHYPGCTEEDLEAYGLEEDLEWRAKMERQSAAGKDGFVGHELDCFAAKETQTIPVAERTGDLWKYGAQLEQEMGIVLDTKGYSSCFRVNRKHQPNEKAFEALLSMSGPALAPTLATSTNLGCIDFYPVDSGKKNCCQYLIEKLCSNEDDENPLNIFGPNTLQNNALCLCDDDNDMEMAMSCHHAFLPGISSKSMKDMVSENAGQFTVTETKDIEGALATERALELLLKRLPPPLHP